MPQKAGPQIVKSASCGNSPKNQLLQDLVIALACADFARIRQLVSKDLRWLAVGNRPLSGVDTVCKAITRHGLAGRLVIEHVVSHGKAGAVNGIVEFGGKPRGFCHVFEFSSARGTEVSSITTYSVGLTGSEPPTRQSKALVAHKRAKQAP